MKRDTSFAHPALYSLRIEQLVLGTMLLEEPAALDGLAKLGDNYHVFFDERHQLIYRAFLHRSGRQEKIDLVLITQTLHNLGWLQKADGPSYLQKLTLPIGQATNFGDHCRELLGFYTRRRLQQLAQGIYDKAGDPTEELKDVLADLQTNLLQLGNSLATNRPRQVSELLAQAHDEIEAAAALGTGITGVPSGLHALDKETGGWQPGDLIIIAARPAMGKTSSALAAGRNAAGEGYNAFDVEGDQGRHAAVSHQRPGLFVSLEMGQMQLVKKLIATETSYTTAQLTRGDFDHGLDEAKSLRGKTDRLNYVRMYIDDTPGMTVHELRAKAAQAKKEWGIEWLMVDYLQLMQGEKRGTREQEISSISRGLKLIAKELNIPVIALSQLSRAVESRAGDKKPQLSDLRESGAIEQDADVIIFPYRPEYYGITEDEMGNPTADMTEFIIAKQRNGGLTSVVVESKMKYGRYRDLPEAAKPTTEAYGAATPAEPDNKRLQPNTSFYQSEKDLPF